MYRQLLVAALAVLIPASPAVAQFPVPPFTSCVFHPNNAGVGSHGVAVDSTGDVYYVPVGASLVKQPVPIMPAVVFPLPHSVVNLAIDPTTDDIYMSGSTGRVLRSPAGGGPVNAIWGPVGVCSFLDHIHFHSDGMVYTTCLDGNWIIRIDPLNPGAVAGVNFDVFPAPTVNSATSGITGDFTGDLWSIERSAHNVVRAVPASMVPNTSAGITEFPIPSPPYSPETVKACLNNVWFTGLSDGLNGPRLDFIDITSLAITQIDVNPGGFGGTYGLAVDGNGNPFATTLGSAHIVGIDVGAGFTPVLFPTPAVAHHIAISPTAGDFWFTNFQAGVWQCVPDVPVPATCVPTAAPLDHYKCYEADGDEVDAVVSLVDQFEAVETQVGGPELFCNPVAKTTVDGEVTNISDPNAHQTGYEIESEDDVTRRVVVSNQFGDEQVLIVQEAELLFVPSEKNGAGSELNVDHFKCYKAEGDAVNVIVTLEDQFGLEPDVLVGEPELFCNPVDKNAEGILDEASHLTCYDIEDEKDEVERVVLVSNQLDEQDLEIDEPELLCVPTEKLQVTELSEEED